MNNILTIFQKQIKDTFKNKSVLIQFLMFPIMAVIIENSIPLEDMAMPKHFFVKMFSAMFVGMAPLVSTSAIIAEEKEQNTLRALIMSNITPFQYLLGIGSYVLVLCMLGSVVFAVCGGYSGAGLVQFLLTMAVGILISILFGSLIGIISKNQMAATSLTVPLMMVFSFLPMLAMFNESIAKVAKFVYSEQVYRLIHGIGDIAPTAETLIILATNAFLAFTLFLIAYKKKSLE